MHRLYKLAYEVLHPLNEVVFKDLVNRIKTASGSEDIGFRYWYNGVSEDEAVKIIKKRWNNAIYIDSYWWVDTEAGELWRLEHEEWEILEMPIEIYISKIDKYSFNFEFRLEVGSFLWDDYNRIDFSWYFQQALEVLKPYKICRLIAADYSSNTEREYPKEWVIKAEFSEIGWYASREKVDRLKSLNDYVKEGISLLVQNGLKSGYDFESYVLEESSLLKDEFCLFGTAEWGNFIILIKKSYVYLYPGDMSKRPKNIHSYLDLLLALSKGVRIESISADSFAKWYHKLFIYLYCGRIQKIVNYLSRVKTLLKAKIKGIKDV